MTLSSKSGSVPTQDIIGTSKTEANSATALQAEEVMKLNFVLFFFYKWKLAYYSIILLHEIKDKLIFFWFCFTKIKLKAAPNRRPIFAFFRLKWWQWCKIVRNSRICRHLMNMADQWKHQRIRWSTSRQHFQVPPYFCSCHLSSKNWFGETCAKLFEYN